MDAFWERGFQGTSMQRLVERMGINRGSLYATFGSKEELFQSAVDRYLARKRAALLEAVAGPGEPREVLRRAMLALLVDTQAPLRRGCLVANASVERGPFCARTAPKLLGVWRDIEGCFAEVLERDPALRPRSGPLARLLVTVVRGLAVSIRLEASREEVEEVVDAALSTLR